MKATVVEARLKTDGQRRLDEELRSQAFPVDSATVAEESSEGEADKPLPVNDGPGYSVIHRGQRPTPKPMPDADEQPQKKASAASKPPLQGQQSQRDPEKSVISNAASVLTSGTRASSQNKKVELLKSNILSKEEEARQIKEKKDKMDEIKSRYSRRSR